MTRTRIARRRLAPAAVALLLAAPATAGAQGATTTICHATGDPSTPYQQIELAAEATLEHLQHADDIVPAPAEGCPAQAVIDEPDPAPAYPLPTADPPDVVPGPQRPARRPRRERRRSAPRGAVQPSVSSGSLGATAEVGADTLPLTGAEVPVVALMGLSFLLVGGGLRLRYAPGR